MSSSANCSFRPSRSHSGSTRKNRKTRFVAGAAAQAQKETEYHLRYAREWTIRLGDGTDESHRRAQNAVDDLWAYTGELFERDAVVDAAVGAGLAPDPAVLRNAWTSTVADTLRHAKLEPPPGDWMQSGGRTGRHSEHLGHLLTDLQYMQRTYPGMTW